VKIARHLGLLAEQPAVFVGQRGYVLVLSHMRSRSSLLAHLLGSHPEIDGYSELNQPYTRRRDLMRMRANVSASLEGKPLGGRLLLDKVLHSHHRVGETILGRPDVKVIFLVREPAPTISSILAMNDSLPGLAIYPGERGAVAYYTDRLDLLAQKGRDRGRDQLVVRSEELMADPENTLDRVALYLGLSSPIETTYSTFARTGEPGRGDFSDAIRQGRIVADTDRSAIAIRPELLAEAQRSYARTMQRLDESCAWRPHPKDAVYFPARS